MIRSARILLTILFTYLFTFGATFNAVLIPTLSFATLTVMGLLFVLWLIARWRGKWTWHRTPLDGIALLWVVVIAMPLAANNESWRRILIAVWYMAVYGGVWFVLADCIANGAITRRVVVDAYLFAGLIVVFMGYYQLSLADFSDELPRVTSIIGNPSAMGAFSVVLFMLILGRLFSVKETIGRVVLGLYALSTFVLIILTFSRGTFLAVIVSLVVFTVLATRNADSVAGVNFLRQRWNDLSLLTKAAYILVPTVILGFLLSIGVVLVTQTFTNSDRSLGLRATIYRGAAEAFAEKPLTGHGLFMFGQELARFQSQPRNQPHSHAHNIILHLLAELGLLGLIALCVTVSAVIWLIYRNWQAFDPSQRLSLTAGASAFAGLLAIHLFDTPSMMPLIALIVVIVLALTCLPGKPVPRSARFIPLFGFGVVGVWIGLLATGWWSTSAYADYAAIVRDAVEMEAYRQGGDNLQRVVDADPEFALYVNQQAYLYGLAAHEGDEDALQLGVQAYERYAEMEPHDSIGHANLAVLYWQNGQQAYAIEALETALETAPKGWQYAFLLGTYGEDVEDHVIATGGYKRVLGNSFNLMYPQWEDTAYRQQHWFNRTKPQGIALIVLALKGYPPYADYDADVLWERSQLEDADTTTSYVLRILLALHKTGELPDEVEFWLSEAERARKWPEDEAWIHLAQAEILRFNGDETGAEQEIEQAHDIIAPALERPDYKNGTNIAHFQFLRFGITRQFLPQVLYPTVDTLPLWMLLDVKQE